MMPGRPAAPPRRRGSGGSTGLLLALVALLLILGMIPLGILAYSSGDLQKLFPTLVASPTPAGVAPASGPQPVAAPTAAPPATPAPAQVRVPRLVGKPFSAARQQAQSEGLDIVIVGEVHNAEQPVTNVVRQNPQADASVEKGTKVEVTVSLGPEIVPVPKVVGDTAPVAEGKLQGAGFRWRLVEEWSDQVPAGVVMGQDPAGESRAARESEVTLTVSKGREKVKVPNLIGRPEAEAQDAIVKAGLVKTWVNYQDYTTVPPGHVISQDPKADTLVEKGTTVYIAVRKPEPTATVPTKR